MTYRRNRVDQTSFLMVFFDATFDEADEAFRWHQSKQIMTDEDRGGGGETSMTKGVHFSFLKGMVSGLMPQFRSR
jgi:hypothetical protein